MLFGGLADSRCPHCQQRNKRHRNKKPCRYCDHKGCFYISPTPRSFTDDSCRTTSHSSPRPHSLSPTVLFPRADSPQWTETYPRSASVVQRPLEPGHWQILGSGALIKPLDRSQTFETLLNPYSNLNQDLREARLIAGIMDDPTTEHTTGSTVINTNLTTTDTTHRTPDSPSMNDFFWDPVGDTNYASDTFDSDLYDYEDNRSNARLGRTQEDLHKYKQRIDANVEHQREYSEIMNAMHQKLQEYRKHIAKLESKITNKPISTSDDTTFFPLGKGSYLDAYGAGGIAPNVNISTDVWAGGAGGGFGGGRIAGDSNQNFDIVIKLDEERRRADDFRMQLENERQNNEQLQVEIERIRREYERDAKEKERRYSNRERNLAQYLSDEQKKMLDLWTELQRVRKQFSQLKHQTEEDLENQKREFTKIFKNIQNFSRGVGGPEALTSSFHLGGGDGLGGTTYNLDSVIQETIRRVNNRGGTSPYIADLDLLARLRKGVENKDDNTELYNELMKKYEEAIERNIEIESKGDANVRKVSDLESELRRTRDRLNEAQGAIKKIHGIAINSDRNSESTKRARSLSPADTVVQPAEAIRAVRNILREKDNELQRLEQKVKAAEKQANEFVTKFETADEARRRLDKYLADAKRDVTNLQKHLDNSERQKRRFEDRVRAVEVEKNAAEKARAYLEDELKRLQQIFQKNTTDDARKAREEAEEFASNMEQDYKNRIAELTSRIDSLMKDNTRLKAEISPIKDKYRDLENEYNSLLRRLEEKDSQLKYTEEQKVKVIKDIDNLRNQYDLSRSEIEKFSNDNELLIKKISVLEQQNKELKQQRDEISKQRDELSRQLFDIKHTMETEKTKGTNVEQNVQSMTDEIDKLKSQVGDYENQIVILRRHNDDLDTQLKTSQSKQGVIENDVQTKIKEITTLNELNQRLQKEKQEILDAKHKQEQDLETFKDRIRKLETEIEKLKKENDELAKKEARAQEGMAQQMKRANNLQLDLQDARQKIKELENKLARLEKDYKDRLKNWQRNRQSTKSTDFGGTSVDSSTTGGGQTVVGDPGDLTDEMLTGGGRGGRSTDDPSGGGGGGTTTTNVDNTYITKYGGLGDPSYLDPEIVESRIKDINDKWKIEVEKIENEKDSLEARIRELEDQIAQFNRGEEREKNDFVDQQRKLQNEIDRLKAEIQKINDKHQNELEEEKEVYHKNIDVSRKSESELLDKINKLEQEKADLLNQQNEYDRERREYDEKLTTLATNNQKLKDDIEDIRTETEKEVQTWKTDAYSARSEVKSLETTLAGLKTQLAAATERSEILNKTVNDHVSKIRDLTSQIRKLEEELTDAKSNAHAKEVELDSSQARIRQIEDQLAALQAENNRTRGEFGDINREYSNVVIIRDDLQKENEKISRRNKELETILKESRNSTDHLKNEHIRLQNILREKTKQLDHLQQLSSQFENKMNKLRNELQDTSSKLIASDNERNSLRTEITRLQQELAFGEEQMRRKTDEYQTAIEDWTNAHRQAEDARVNAIQELETRKYELSDLQSRLDSTDQRLVYLQQEYVKADNERDALRESLRRFQNSISRVININRFTNILDGDITGIPVDSGIGGGASGAAGGAYGTNVATTDGSNVDPSGDLTDDVMFKSTPLPSGPGGVDGDGGDPSGAHGGIGGGTTINIATIDSTLQNFVSRIDKLQRERDEYREELNRLKQKTNQAHTTINKRETHYKTIEENLTEVEDDKRTLEVHLAQAKQLIRSQEEAIKQRDEERRQIKSKLTASELQARGKEAQIRHMNEQLHNLRTDLTNAHEELRSLRDKDESLESGRYQLESKLRDHESELQKLSIRITNYESEKQNLTERVKELEGQLKLSEIKNSDLRDDTEKLRRDLLKAEATEADLKKSLDQYYRNSADVQTLRDQLTRLHSELNDANNKRQSLETELVSSRSELRDYKQRNLDFNGRIGDLQRQLQDANLEKNRAENRLIDMEKTLATQRVTETDLKQQFELLKTEKKSVTKEFEEVKTRLSQLESERTSLIRVQDSWKREKQALIKKIEHLEGEKRRTDAAIRETALQREAIEKSLNAMERENRELYKNCAQLQQQIAQLEMDNGARIIELTKKSREEQERQAIKIKTEKQQIERLIESRDRTARQRIQQLEAQIQSLRDQLENERRRRRDLTDRQMVGDMGRFGGNYFGLPTVHTRVGVNGFSSVGPTYPPVENIDSTRYIRSTFASNPLTPPRGASTPTRSQLLTSAHDESSSSLAREHGFDQERHEPRTSLDDTLPQLSHTPRI
ncbi:unnamed protein product [Bursaphelenchus okinawaensis]|uniref:Uncharacterized protein n=1 Tax=Bursaphelenchus okinawaensis TaxID=465554 RepID=A0A811KJ97_9BILA|nr:unnamed protein product [Bursaphelenchus okinawaensis]CAG9104876.1 unnamed protein product [Bursaphelenchus okinawaensis]